jgi:hypothetical protein
MLCPTCQQVFREPAKVDADKGFSAEYKCETTFSAICATAGSCFSCHRTWRRLRATNFRNGGKDPTLGLTFTLKSDVSSDGQITLKIVARHEPSKRDFWVEAIVEEDSRLESRRLYAVTTNSTGSEETLRFVKEKLAECAASHPACQLLTASSVTWYPTRLIQLTASGPRLIETRDHVLVVRIPKSQVSGSLLYSSKTLIELFAILRQLTDTRFWTGTICHSQPPLGRLGYHNMHQRYESGPRSWNKSQIPDTDLPGCFTSHREARNPVYLD